MCKISAYTRVKSSSDEGVVENKLLRSNLRLLRDGERPGRVPFSGFRLGRHGKKLNGRREAINWQEGVIFAKVPLFTSKGLQWGPLIRPTVESVELRGGLKDLVLSNGPHCSGFGG